MTKQAPKEKKSLGARLKSAVLSLGLLLFTSLLCLVLMEVAIRILKPQELIITHPEIWQPEAPFGHRHRANVDTTIHRGDGLVHMVTDDNGYRINRDPATVPADADISILTIGDSFIEALAVENEAAIPEVLRRLLESEHGLAVEAANGGVAAWNPNHYLLEVKRELARRAYDLGIVFIYTANDIKRKKVDSFPPRPNRPRRKFTLPKSLGRDDLEEALFLPVNDMLEGRSHLFILLKGVFETQLAKAGLTHILFPPVFETRGVDSPAWELTAEICASIRDEFAAHQTPMFFVVVPAVYQVHEEVFERYVQYFSIDPDKVDLQQPNRLLREKLEPRGMVLVDPLPRMREVADGGTNLFALDRHFNEAGHRVVAEFILPTAESFLFGDDHSDTDVDGAGDEE